jgi:hypothetical protein
VFVAPRDEGRDAEQAPVRVGRLWLRRIGCGCLLLVVAYGLLAYWCAIDLGVEPKNWFRLPWR